MRNFKGKYCSLKVSSFTKGLFTNRILSDFHSSILSLMKIELRHPYLAFLFKYLFAPANLEAAINFLCERGVILDIGSECLVYHHITHIMAQDMIVKNSSHLLLKLGSSTSQKTWKCHIVNFIILKMIIVLEYHINI